MTILFTEIDFINISRIAAVAKRVKFQQFDLEKESQGSPRLDYILIALSSLQIFKCMPKKSLSAATAEQLRTQSNFQRMTFDIKVKTMNDFNGLWLYVQPF